MNIFGGCDGVKGFINLSFGIRVFEFDLFDQEWEVSEETVLNGVKILQDGFFIWAKDLE